MTVVVKFEVTGLDVPSCAMLRCQHTKVPCRR